MARSSAENWSVGTRPCLYEEYTKNVRFPTILGMALPGVESVGAPQENVFCLFPASQRPYMAKTQNPENKSRK